MKTRIWKSILILSFAFACNLRPAFAQFEDLGVGARGIGMGNAFIGLADDGYSIYYNPAGLGRIGWQELVLDYGKLYWGLDDNSNLGQSFVGYAQSLKRVGTLGVGWLNLSLTRYYREDTFMLAYGKRILNSKAGSLAAGFNLKVLSKGFKKTLYTENAANLDTGQVRGGRDPVFEDGYSRMGFSSNLGLLYDLGRHHSFGLALNDINQPDMGLASRDKIALATKLGYAYRGRNFNMTSDIIFKKKDITVLAGAEKWFMGTTLAIRGGLGIGTREYASASLGASYRYSRLFQFDYSFVYPLQGVSSFYGSHRFSLTLRFGVKVPEEVELEEELAKLKEREAMMIKGMELAANYYKEAIEDSKNGLYKEALMKLRLAVDLDPKKPEIQSLFKKLSSIVDIMPRETRLGREVELIRRAVGYYIEDEAKKAIFTLQYASLLSPGNKEIPKLLNIISRDYPAIADQEKLSEGMMVVEQKLYRALNYLYQNRSDLAIVECQEVLELEPNNTLALSRLGSAYYVIGQKEKAKEFWLRVFELEPGNKEVLEFLRKEGVVLPEKRPEALPKEEDMIKEFEKAIDYYRRIEKDLDIDGKIGILQSIVDKFKPSGIDVSGVEKQLREFKKEKVEAPSIKKPASLEASIKQKFSDGMNEYKKGNYNRAIANWEELVKVQTDDPKLNKIIEEAKRKIFGAREEKIKKMEKHYNNAVEFYKKRRWEEAMAELDEILKLEPNHKQSIEFRKKIEEKVQERNKTEAEELYTQGLKSYSEGKLEEAAEVWKKALKLEPSNERFQKALEAIEKEIKLREEKK